MQVDITQIIITLIGALTTILTTCIIPYIRNKKILFWTKMAVSAANQIYQESGLGAEKNAYVKQFLASKGVSLSEEDLNVMIEGALYQIEHAISE